MFVDVPMHLLFLGITKTVMNDISDWLKSKLNHNSFFKMSIGILEKIQDLQVQWCRVLPYSKTKFGGWVSENYLGFSRISKWFYSLLHFLPEDNKHIGPTTDHHKWSRKECYDWLNTRDLDSFGTFKELKERVLLFKNTSNGTEISVKNSIVLADALLLIQAYNQMISYLMKTEYDEKDCLRVEIIIINFLHNYAKFTSTSDSNKLPSWASHYNFLSLLNVPNQVKMFGPLRLIWEGGTIGEGYLRKVKAELNTGLRKCWQIWLIEHLLTNHSYEQILLETAVRISPNMIFREKVCSLCKVYQSATVASTIVHIGTPFSGIMASANNFFICFCLQKKIHCMKIVIVDHTATVNGMKYYHLIVDHSEIFEIDYLETFQIIGTMFLPKLTAEGYQPTQVDNIHRFCYVYSDWSTS
jgi:hypothetical protein